MKEVGVKQPSILSNISMDFPYLCIWSFFPLTFTRTNLIIKTSSLVFFTRVKCCTFEVQVVGLCGRNDPYWCKKVWIMWYTKSWNWIFELDQMHGGLVPVLGSASVVATWPPSLQDMCLVLAPVQGGHKMKWHQNTAPSKILAFRKTIYRCHICINIVGASSSFACWVCMFLNQA